MLEIKNKLRANLLRSSMIGLLSLGSFFLIGCDNSNTQQTQVDSSTSQTQASSSTAQQVAVVEPSNTTSDKIHQITILHTNDHHGRFWHNDIGEYGLSAQKTVVDRVRAEVEGQGGTVLLLSGGDVNTGVPESDLQKAEPDFKGMSYIGYDAMALGNHEFDNALEVLRQQEKWATFPLLSANIYFKGTKERPFKPYTIFEKQGVKIAVIGLTTDDTKHLANIEYVQDYDFRLPAEEANELIPLLKAEENPDIIIAATHMGHYDDGDHGSLAPGDVTLARSLPKGYLNMIVGGHSQDPVCMAEENVREKSYVPGTPCAPDNQNGTWIVQAHEWGKYVGRADFTFQHGEFTLKSYELIPVNLKKQVKDDNGVGRLVYYTEEIERDPEMMALLTPYQEHGQEQLMVKIGEIDGKLEGDRSVVRFQQANSGRLIGTAMIQRSPADFAVIGGGSIRDSILPGDVTYRDVLRVLPFHNSLVYVDLKGSEVIDYLHGVVNKKKGAGGYVQYTNIGLETDGVSVSNVSIAGEPLDLDKTYRMVTFSFFAMGGDGYPDISVHPTYVDTGFVIAEVLKNFIEANSPISMEPFEPKDEIKFIESPAK